MTFNYYPGTLPKNKKTFPIYLYMREGAKGSTTIKVNTKVELLPGQWNNKKKSIRKGVTDEAYYNQKLAGILAKARKRYDELQSSGKRYTTNEIKVEIEKVVNPEFITKDKKSFDDVKKIFLDSMETQFTLQYANRFRVLFNIIDDFSLAKREAVSLERFDMVFYEMFAAYLTKDRKHSDNTKGKTITLLKTFLKWCRDNNLTEQDHYTKYKVTKSKVDLPALSESEVDAIYNLDLSNSPGLERVRDSFIFACETGARFSDIQAISRHDIKNNWWKYYPKKTPEVLASVYLSARANGILKKYEKHIKPLYVISGQKSNEYLKVICEKAGIKSPMKERKFIGGKLIQDKDKKYKYQFISFHSARRTFVSISRENDVPFEIVMAATAQSPAMMMHYNKANPEKMMEKMLNTSSQSKSVVS